MSTVFYVSVVRDFAAYGRYFRDNPNLEGGRFAAVDNRQDNQPIPRRYNRFLDAFDYGKPAWLVFCHEDFEFLEPLAPLLENLPEDALYGPVGAVHSRFLGLTRCRFAGEILEQDRKTGEVWKSGRAVPAMTAADTFDCCCLIVHSSLVRAHGLRFDETLAFDLYVEDFCASAALGHKIPSRVLPVKAVHHSGSRPSGRLYRHLPYLREKYPRRFFAATCCYFGTFPLIVRIQKQAEKILLPLLRRTPGKGG